MCLIRAGLSKGLRRGIAQGHHKIGSTTLADCKMNILVAYIIYLKGTYICDPVIFIYFLDKGEVGRHQDIGFNTHWWHVGKLRTKAFIY